MTKHLIGCLLVIAGIGWFMSLKSFDSPTTSTQNTKDEGEQNSFASNPHAAMSSVPIDLVQKLTSGAISFDDLARRAANDRDYRYQLRAAYLNTQDPTMRATLLELLTRSPASELLIFTDGLIADKDPARRLDGYKLVTALPLDDDRVRQQVLNGLRNEKDNAALGTLLDGLQPGLIAAEDADQIADQLLEFSVNADPHLRADVLPKLSQWFDNEDLEEPYFNALKAGHADVRAAAVAGIVQSRVRSPRLREALFELASNSEESGETRQVALQALLNFRLSHSEIDLFRLLQSEVPIHPGDN
ncbi:MAG: hypothetical protein ACREO1_16415 [Arenimonas sp.]